MVTTAEPVTASEVAVPQRRIESIDIFRGLTMLVMIFVNDLDSVRGLPWWTHHAHAYQDAMTYVDMVFPFFLFAVGLSLPISVRQRLRKDPSLIGLLWHILSRSAGLLVLGLILANAEKCDSARMGISGAAWALLGLSGAILFWHVPIRELRQQWVSKSLRFVGFVLLCLTFALFRRRMSDGSTGWIDGSYPEILGLIGYTYFSTAIAYVMTRRWIWAPFAWMGAFIALCAILTWNHNLLHLPLYVWPVGKGGMDAIVMAGVCASTILFAEQLSWPTAKRLWVACAFAAASALSALLLTPLGISKIRETPTWCLYSASASILVIALFYWVCDIRRQTRWALIVHSAGANTLLTYLLPDIFYFATALIGFTYLNQHFSAGMPGVARAVAFTLAILGISMLATKARLRLQL